MDAQGEDPWLDLWFYSNPIFIEVPQHQVEHRLRSQEHRRDSRERVAALCRPIAGANRTVATDHAVGTTTLTGTHGLRLLPEELLLHRLAEGFIAQLQAHRIG
jgi:hypothetical protein